MSLPRTTPRLMAAIPQPAPVPHASNGVIPIRGMTPRTPMQRVATPVIPIETVRRRHVPVGRRPWRVMLVPPTPGSRTRAFALARWQARAILSVVLALLLVTAGTVTAVLVALKSPDLITPGRELTALRDRLSAVEDSLTVARAVLAESSARADSLAAAPSTGTNRAPASGVKSAAPIARVRARSTAAAMKILGPARLSLDGLPVVGTIVSGFSASRRHPILNVLRPHRGIDIAAVRGTRVAAPANGRVSFVGRRFAMGLMVEITHEGGITTRYAHLRAAFVREGQQVTRGEAIATVGTSGLTTGPHLHYEVAVNGVAVDPLHFRMPHSEDSVATLGTPPVPVVAAPSASAAHDEAATGSVPR